MLIYEMPLLIRAMNKADIATTLRRAAQAIFNEGGYIRKIDNLGLKELPCKTAAHGRTYRTANVFIFHFNAPPSSIHLLSDEYGRDNDIIRNTIFKQNIPSPEPCTFEDETVPPPYRKKVKEMLNEIKRHQNPPFKHNTGLGYYPFPRL